MPDHFFPLTKSILTMFSKTLNSFVEKVKFNTHVRRGFEVVTFVGNNTGVSFVKINVPV